MMETKSAADPELKIELSEMESASKTAGGNPQKNEGKLQNIFTADVEDYYHVSAFEEVIKYSDWGKFKSRIIPNILSLLALMERANVKGTFFILGWVAEKFPEVVTLIHQNGHEVGCHSYLHRLVYRLTKDQFREDTKKAKLVLEDIIGARILGYRAPSFSVTKQSRWAWDILEELGFEYSSSVYPIKHDRYGFQQMPRTVFKVKTNAGNYFKEIPMSTIKVFRQNFPVAGGGYLRLYPYWFTRMAIRKLNHENIPAVVYVHPWEIDRHQPRIACNIVSKLRHYTNLHTTERKLSMLFSDFNFIRMRDFVENYSE